MRYGRYQVAKITRRNWQDRYPDKPAWDALRKPVVNKKCSKCGVTASKNNPIEGGHKIAISKGGRNIRLNLGGECRRCNRLKSRRGKL
jgi:hypothetical protein